MIRIRSVRRTSASLAAVAVMVVGLAACGGTATTDQISGPAILPGTVPSSVEDTASAEADTPTADDATDTATADGEFVLDLSGADLPDVEDAAGAPITGTDLAIVQRSVESASAGSYRFSVDFAMTIEGDGQSISIAPGTPVVVGEASGQTQRSVTDLAVMFESMWEEMPDADVGELRDLFGGDMTIETIVDGATMYFRAPILGAIGAGGGPGLPADFSSLGDGWGRVDLDRVPGLTSDEVAALAGTQTGSGPDEMLAMLEAADADIVDLGDSEVGGVPVRHFRAEVDVAASLASGAVDVGSLGLAPSELESLFVEGPTIDVYIDADDHVRRMVMSFAAEGLPGVDSMAMSTSIDFSDHGADISIDVPDDAVDLTSAFLTLAGGI